MVVVVLITGAIKMFIAQVWIEERTIIEKPNADENENKKADVLCIFRSKFPTTGSRSNFNDHEYITKRYFIYIDNILTSLSMPEDQMHDNNIFNVTKDKYEKSLAIYLASVHPKKQV